MAFEPAIDTDECTIEDIERDEGRVADVTGDYAAGRTHIHRTSEDFLACLASQPYEPGDG